MSNSTPPPTDALTAATQMVKNGRLDQARETLMGYLVKNPSSEQAWLLMSYVLSDPAKQKDCLERVLRINPNNTVAQSKLAHLLGRRTEELFRKSGAPPTAIPSKPEPEPAPEPTPEPPPEPVMEPKPVPAAVPIPPPAERPVAVPSPAKHPIAGPPPVPTAQIAPEPDNPLAALVPSPKKKSLFSGKSFRIITIVLVALILVIAAVIFYIGVIGPAINSLSITPTPTLAPVVLPTYLPPKFTQTLTPTETPTPPPTFTPTLTPTLVPSETTIS